MTALELPGNTPTRQPLRAALVTSSAIIRPRPNSNVGKMMTRNNNGATIANSTVAAARRLDRRANVCGARGAADRVVVLSLQGCCISPLQILLREDRINLNSAVQSKPS